jgi:hypothetical protein
MGGSPIEGSTHANVVSFEVGDASSSTVDCRVQLSLHVGPESFQIIEKFIMGHDLWWDDTILEKKLLETLIHFWESFFGRLSMRT